MHATMTKLVSFNLTNITLLVNLKDEISLRTFNCFFFFSLELSYNLRIEKFLNLIN